MNCPKCGTQMNHHADKTDRSATLTESETVDPELAGIFEVHACPTCGNTEVRKAVWGDISGFSMVYNVTDIEAVKGQLRK